MVRLEERLHNERKIAQQWLVGADLPIVGDPYPRPFLDEGPDAASDEISRGFQREAIPANLGDAKLPAQCIGQPALGIQAHDFAQARRVTRLELLDVEIY